MVKYEKIVPPVALASFVRCFWVLESDEPSYIHRSLADVCPELLFHYRGRFDQIFPSSSSIKSFSSGVHAQSKEVTSFHINSAFSIFGVYLFPYTIPCLLGIPASELTNQLVDLQTLLGKEGIELEEKVMLAADNNQRVRILSQYLEEKLLPKNIHHPAIFSSINYIIEMKGSVKVKELCDKYFLSERQFERRFKEFAGFTPKLFSRISRFSSAVSEYSNSYKSLTEIAYQCGYYDQSHFIQDFKEFSGHNPRHFFSGAAEGLGWMNV